MTRSGRRPSTWSEADTHLGLIRAGPGGLTAAGGILHKPEVSKLLRIDREPT